MCGDVIGLRERQNPAIEFRVTTNETRGLSIKKVL